MRRAAFACAVALCGCFVAAEPPAESTDEPTACLDAARSVLAADCTPAYEPTFANVFANTLQPSCGKAGGTCHGSAGQMGGLTFVEPGESHQALQRAGWLRPGDAACSPLMAVLESSDPMQRMPPAAPLPEAERCAVARWLANGARAD